MGFRRAIRPAPVPGTVGVSIRLLAASAEWRSSDAGLWRWTAPHPRLEAGGGLGARGRALFAHAGARRPRTGRSAGPATATGAARRARGAQRRRRRRGGHGALARARRRPTRRPLRRRAVRAPARRAARVARRARRIGDGERAARRASRRVVEAGRGGPALPAATRDAGGRRTRCWRATGAWPLPGLLARPRGRPRRRCATSVRAGARACRWRRWPCRTASRRCSRAAAALEAALTASASGGSPARA